MARGIVLGQSAVNQIGVLVREYLRDHQNDPPFPQRQPVLHGSDSVTVRWGVLQSDLMGQSTTPVFVAEELFRRNDADSGNAGGWEYAYNDDGSAKKFKVIEALLPVDKRLASGTRVACAQIARDLWAPIASQCPTASGISSTPPPEPVPAPTPEPTPEPSPDPTPETTGSTLPPSSGGAPPPIPPSITGGQLPPSGSGDTIVHSYPQDRLPPITMPPGINGYPIDGGGSDFSGNASLPPSSLPPNIARDPEPQTQQEPRGIPTGLGINGIITTRPWDGTYENAPMLKPKWDCTL